jgi:dolichol-phosphate mannosyltransferase
MQKLSIIIPAYNEERYIQGLLEKISNVPTEKLGFEKEIIVVDDGSTDRTLSMASAIPGIKVIAQVPNQGKGKAVQRGIQESSGAYILVQDADLEYDPRDYLPMLEALATDPQACVYGSRTLGQVKEMGWGWLPGKHPKQGFGPWLAGCVLSLWTALLYQKWISDTLTAYKIYPSTAIKKFNVKTCGFETDHELTAKLIRDGISILEVPIRYEPRSRAEGKKIKLKDGWTALWTLLRFRFSD